MKYLQKGTMLCENGKRRVIKVIFPNCDAMVLQIFHETAIRVLNYPYYFM